MYMAAYEWRLSFQNTEVRDQTLSRMKSNIELMVATNGGKKVVVIPHSMGVLYFLHFMKWVEATAPMGGGGGSDWCAKHIKAVMNIGGPFLGVPKSVSGLFSVEARDIAVASVLLHLKTIPPCFNSLFVNIRAFAPGFLDKDVFGLQNFQHLMRMTRTWDSTMSMIPKGGDTIWGGLDWSPEGESFKCGAKELRNNSINSMVQNANINLEDNVKSVNYGRIISFGKDVAEAHSSTIKRVDFQDAVKSVKLPNLTTNCDIWIEYHEIGNHHIKSVADNKVYTAGSILDLLYFVAPKLMARGGAHFSYGIADNLDDPKYQHYKYWSNPLEINQCHSLAYLLRITRLAVNICELLLLPNAPDMEIYSMYGVGIPTERAYVYKLNSGTDCSIPFQIDTSAEGDSEDSCLKGGVFSADGDETVPVLSAGFMCAKGWRGKTRFNPSGIRTYIREYNHAPPANLLEGRGTQSGTHVDIMGNFALIEDDQLAALASTSTLRKVSTQRSIVTTETVLPRRPAGHLAWELLLCDFSLEQASIDLSKCGDVASVLHKYVFKKPLCSSFLGRIHLNYYLSITDSTSSSRFPCDFVFTLPSKDVQVHLVALTTCQAESRGKDVEARMKPVFLINDPNTMFSHSSPNNNHSMAPAQHPYADAYFGGLFTPYGQPDIVRSSKLFYLAAVIQARTGGGSAPARILLPLDLAEDGLVYVNAKQYNGILRRRRYRAKLEAQNKLV
ncbi:putative phospholipid:diacylglycerol acyltransferase 2 [Hibiscus syriacus]|uniref:Phospholipid:diacylglycerol acyltransferase 2 n=1 Tax=Hibiscus syriacus TaxID=106335 RepID=A0A6A2ZA91_HIBSY|nr:putative phospholipid:diacylglycerol acyltransferase 2 [Hibiscus syriacus]